MCQVRPLPSRQLWRQEHQRVGQSGPGHLLQEGIATRFVGQAGSAIARDLSLQDPAPCVWRSAIPGVACC